MTNTINIEKTRKAYATAAGKEKGALKAYSNDLAAILADVPDQILAEYTGDIKDIPAGSHLAKIRAESDALKEVLIAAGINKKSVRVYWQRAFNPVLAARGIKKKGKTGKASKASKTSKTSKTSTEASGYTREKVIATITNIAAWVRENDAPDFSVADTVKGLELALKGLNKVVIGK